MVSGINIVKKKVFFSNLSVEKLIRKYNTPLFVFSEQRLIDNFVSLGKAFKKHYPKTSIYYSIKTNYETQLLSTLRKAGSFGEAASALEVEIAEKAGFQAPELILDGPAWTDDDIATCIKKGVAVLNADSLDLMKKVDKIARKLNKRVNVSFRIYPEIKMSILKSFIEGYIAKFGIRLSDAVSIYKEASRLRNINLIAISAHIGSMVTDPTYYEKTVEKLVTLAKKLKDAGISIESINIGGGFGIQSLNYYSIQNVILNKAGISQYSKAASIEEFGRRIGTKFKESLKSNGLPELELILEPGRFIASDSGILLTKVISVKKNWIFIDGGINLIPESIFFIRRGFIVANKVGIKPDHKYNIAGPTLNTADVLAVNQKLPKIEVGDTIIVLDAGAYSLSRSNQFTILRPSAIYINKNGKVKLLRKPERPKEILDKLMM